MLKRMEGPTRPLRLPFRKAKGRDTWEQSEEALEVKARWEVARRGGGQVSFDEKGEADMQETSAISS